MGISAIRGAGGRIAGAATRGGGVIGRGGAAGCPAPIERIGAAPAGRTTAVARRAAATDRIGKGMARSPIARSLRRNTANLALSVGLGIVAA